MANVPVAIMIPEGSVVADHKERKRENDISGLFGVTKTMATGTARRRKIYVLTKPLPQRPFSSSSTLPEIEVPSAGFTME